MKEFGGLFREKIVFILLKLFILKICLTVFVTRGSPSGKRILHGMRLGDFPKPDFTTTINSVESQNGKSSFKRVKLPNSFDAIPDLVRVYASTQDGDSAGFKFEGTGACQNPGSKGYYGGFIFAYNSREVRIWAPTKYYGNTNGKIIDIEDGWGGEKYTQSSRIADVTIEVWSKIVTPNFQTQIQVDTSKGFYEVPHKLKQIPDFISVRVFSRNINTLDKNLLFHFHAVGASQNPPGTYEYGGVVFGYNEKFVHLWLPNSGKNSLSGCIKITKGWGNGKYAKEMNSRTCQIEIRAWINSFPAPVFQTDWEVIRANAHKKSFREIYHDLGINNLIVQVQMRIDERRSKGFIFEGMGSIQATQTGRSKYGGLLFAYDKHRLRIWVPSSDIGEKGRVIYVSDSWGNGTHLLDFDKAEYRIRIYAPKCQKSSDIVDGQGVCRDAAEIGLTWKANEWGTCSSSCQKGIQSRDLVGCDGIDMEDVFSCDFENSQCNMTSKYTWKRSRGFNEKKRTLYGFTQPPYGFKKGSYFMYSVLQKISPGSITQIHSPMFKPKKNCKLRFVYNTGVYFHRFEVHILSRGKRILRWRMTDKQAGHPYLWFPGFVNLEQDLVEQFRFSLRLSDRCGDRCGYVAFDDVTLQCESEKRRMISLDSCKQRSAPLPGCVIDVLQPLHKGPAYSEQKTEHGTYVKANGTFSDQIATYNFKTEVDGFYSIWLDLLGTSTYDNSVTYHVDDQMQISSHLIVKKKEPTWNCLSRNNVYLKAGLHKLFLTQYEKGFRYRTLIVAPKSLVTWSSLGLQNVHINDLLLKSGLQTREDEEKGPLIRLNGQGAWQTNDANFNWIHWEVGFPDLALVYKVAIQGGCQEADVCCAADQFQLSFSMDGKYFAKYRNLTGGKHMFPGASRNDPNRAVVATLHHAVPARGIRFYPFQTFLPLTCLRVEVYGHYMTKGMCSHAGMKPDLTRSCVGDRNCGPNAECLPTESGKSKGAHETCQCSPGFHGERCQDVGCHPNPCYKGSCSIQGQIFKCSCQAGFSGKFCQLPCPKDKYGLGCNETCNCPGRSICDGVTGECNCERGYTGILCNEVCPNGYYGTNCAQVCKCSSLTVCDHVTGSCHCPLGFYGRFCDIPCPSDFYGKNCSSPCQCAKHSKCLATNGTCVCPAGWTGAGCFKPCPAGKFGKGCSNTCNCPKNSVCNKVNGRCACQPGWEGANCDRKCEPKSFGRGCLLACRCAWSTTHSCDPVNGKCACKAGFTGERCENPCPYGRYGSDCKSRCLCQNNARCDAETGICRCLAGFIGKYCQQVCPAGKYGIGCRQTCRCVSNQTEACDFRKGTCSCLPGYKGRKCHRTCPNGYWGKNCEIQCLCYNKARCDPIDGFCSCTAGWQGESCESACSNNFFGPGCKSPCKCKNGAKCDRFNGNCTCSPGYLGEICDRQCQPWRFGLECKHSCSCDKSTSSKCSNVDGTCSCKAGYQGQRCGKVCDDGKYGIDCRYTCPNCSYHVTGSCDKSTGICRCSPGYHGVLCYDYCPLDKYGLSCQSNCNCTQKQICSNIDGACFARENYEFFLMFRQGNNEFRSTELRRNMVMNLERLLAKYYSDFIKLVNHREKRDVGDTDGTLLESSVENSEYDDVSESFERAADDHLNHFDKMPRRELSLEDIASKMGPNVVIRVKKRAVESAQQTSGCEGLSTLTNADKFSVRITKIQDKYDKDGNPIANIGMVALYKSQPQDGTTVEKFLSTLPENCLLMKQNCKDCSLYSGKLYDSKPEDTPIDLWMIVGSSIGGLFVCVLIAALIVRYKRQQYIASSIYKVKKNSRDIELRHCLANGDGGHVLAFENPYYDVIAAMGLDDDIEEDYYNPLFTYDDVSLYCDDQASESGTETNNEDGYLYPYDRDSGISSGTIHQG